MPSHTLLVSYSLACLQPNRGVLRYTLPIARKCFPPCFACKAFSFSCIVSGNFYGEIVFKTVVPLILAAAIACGSLIRRRTSAMTKTNTTSLGRGTTAHLLALLYVVLTPATNAALRAFSCEVRCRQNYRDKEFRNSTHGATGMVEGWRSVFRNANQGIRKNPSPEDKSSTSQS